MFRIMWALLFLPFIASAQLPNPALVGYWEGWGTQKLTDADDRYNVIQLAFAVTKGNSLYDMEFSLPFGYSKVDFLSDIDQLHSEGKVVILSIGGAADPVRLDNATALNRFVNSMNQIMEDYSYKIDGIDIDLESSSLGFGAWTMASPAVGQNNMISGIQQVMENFKTQTNKKLLLTMAPETVYVQGGLSSWQVDNINGGAYLPIIEALKDDLDMINCQLYNAGGANGGSFDLNGKLYYDTGDADYITAMTETLIKGFTIKSNKGAFSGLKASQIGIGLPAAEDNCSAGIGVSSGFVEHVEIVKAMKYIQGDITKPVGWDYTLTTSYPDIRGMMTWSLTHDATNCKGNWKFAEAFESSFPTTITSLDEIKNEKLKIYPNPVKDILHFDIASGSGGFYRVKSLLGNQVIYGDVESSTVELNVSGLESGTYILEVNGVNQMFIVE